MAEKKNTPNFRRKSLPARTSASDRACMHSPSQFYVWTIILIVLRRCHEHGLVNYLSCTSMLNAHEYLCPRYCICVKKYHFVNKYEQNTCTIWRKIDHTTPRAKQVNPTKISVSCCVAKQFPSRFMVELLHGESRIQIYFFSGGALPNRLLDRDGYNSSFRYASC